MKSCYSRFVAISGLLSILCLCGAASYGQEIPDIKKMQESLGDLAKQHECPGFVKAMVPSDGNIILCSFNPTPVNTTIEMKATAGKSPRFSETYAFEFKITSFDPKMGMWAMLKDQTTRQENAKAEEIIKEKDRDAKESPKDTGPVEVKALNDGTGQASYQRRTLSEEDVFNTGKVTKAPEDIYICDYFVIQANGLVIEFHAIAASKEMADGWLENIRAKLTQNGY